jgi:uncharacterized protein with PIN domain
MPQAWLRFYAELNDFLSPDHRGLAFVYSFHGSPTLRDVVEGLGPPHTEVALILVDGQQVPDTRRLHGGERVSVFPVWRVLGIGGVPASPDSDPMRFILDVHLGRLARLLRLLGFDCLYANELDDVALTRLAAEQGRVVLSRDRGVLKRGIVERGYCVRSQQPREQAVEVLRRFDLCDACQPFTRCLACNGDLRPAGPAEVAGRVPERLRQDIAQFAVCGGCGRAYWPGSHFERLQAVASALLVDGRRRG